MTHHPATQWTMPVDNDLISALGRAIYNFAQLELAVGHMRQRLCDLMGGNIVALPLEDVAVVLEGDTGALPWDREVVAKLRHIMRRYRELKPKRDRLLCAPQHDPEPWRTAEILALAHVFEVAAIDTNQALRRYLWHPAPAVMGRAHDKPPLARGIQGMSTMSELTSETRRMIGDAARRHGVSEEAALAVFRALVDGGGGMAQFSHPELGGMGQWTQGGMVMVGDMFNQDLRRRVDALCADLAQILRDSQSSPAAPVGTSRPSGASRWWPAELGAPTSTGAQNGVRYAYFDASSRLAVEQDGRLTLYDTGDHRIHGVAQHQGGDRSLVFTSQRGTVRVTDLPALRS